MKTTRLTGSSASRLFHFFLWGTLLACVWMMVCAGCGEKNDATGPTESVTVAIGPEGGTIAIDGGNLTIPSNALTQTTDITLAVTELGAPNVSGRTRVTKSFRIEPMNLRLVESALLCIDYDTRRLPMDVTPSLFDMRRLDSTESQERLTGVSVDIDRGHICGEILRGGVFWATVPSGLRPASIQLEASPTILSVGDTAQITATVTDQMGRSMTDLDAGLTFSTACPSILLIDGTGLVTALAPGHATVTAIAGAARAQVSFQVRDDTNDQLHFQWIHPLPQGNSLTALTQDLSGRLVFATTDGSLWREESQGTNQFKQLYRISGVRFAEIAFRGSAIVAAGAMGQSGLILTLTEQTDGSFTATVATAQASPLTKLYLSDNQGIAIGSGAKTLIENSDTSIWLPVESPTFHRLVAGNIAHGSPRVLTSAGAIYEYNALENTWTKMDYSYGPNDILDAVAEPDGFAAVTPDGLFYRIHFEKGWLLTARLLPDPNDENAHDLPLEDGGSEADDANIQDGSTEDNDGGISDGSENLDDPPTEHDNGGSMDGGADQNNDPDTGDSPDLRPTITSIRGIFSLADNTVLIRMETVDGPKLLLEKSSDDSSNLFELIPVPSNTSSIFSGTSFSKIVSGGKGGELYGWDGEKWLELSSGNRDWIIDLKAFEDGTVLALTERCLDANCYAVSNALLQKSPGDETFVDITIPEGFSGRMHAMEGHSSSDYWVMGEGVQAFHWQNNTWQPVSTGTLGSIYGLQKCGDSIFSAGIGGTIGKETDGVWTEFTRVGGATLRDLSCSPKDNLATFAVGDYQILTWNNGEFASITPNDNAIRTAYWTTVYATDTGEAFIGGNARYILFWNGVQFDYVDYPAKLSVYSVKKIHGTSLTNVWAAGTLITGEGFLVHFNGAEWTKIDLPSVRPILALDNTMNHLWIGGGNGTILQGNREKN